MIGKFSDMIGKFSDMIGKFSDMIGTLPYVVGSCRCHSILTKEMYISLRSTPKEGTVRRWRFYKMGNGQKLADQVTRNMEGNSAEFASSGKCSKLVI